ncbi:MlaD family protein [Futiania mangrovi]|uniref:MlaD family protein n=1 Tax=Futiania mangrovi TaxID=2959716 RepID=A0A9J6PFY1_9PROT|nr:MlaD family protein [Futiania mangrovii]MCP1335018.1 MlaD family protein [Futiania mangrovii]
METRANHFLIGLFTLLGLAAGTGLLIWFANVQVSREFAYYDILFKNTAGLSRAGDVRYNGVLVGQVADIAIDTRDPGKVRVRVEVDAETPVNEDTIATLELQGVTGVSFVSLQGGGPASAPLEPGPGERYAEIPSKDSAFQDVLTAVPELLSRAIELLDEVRGIVNDDNKARIASILKNVDEATADLTVTLQEVRTLTGELGVVVGDVRGFTGNLGELTDAAGQTIRTADATLDSARAAIERANAAIATVDRLVEGEVTALVADLRGAVRQADTVFADASGAIATVSGRVETLSATAEETLATATETFAAANRTLAGIDRLLAGTDGVVEQAEAAFATVNRVLDGDIAPLAGDVRKSVATANGAIERTAALLERELPAITREVRSAVGRANGFVGELEGLVIDNRAPLNDFIQSGLPQFVRFVQEARQLVLNLERVTARIEADPARFLLGTQTPEYRPE